MNLALAAMLLVSLAVVHVHGFNAACLSSHEEDTDVEATCRWEKTASTAKFHRNVNVRICNSQATGPGGYPSIPEADTVVERPNLVQNVRIPPSSCCKTAFACILLHLRAGRNPKMPSLRSRIVRRK
jgi:hypothetical protein